MESRDVILTCGIPWRHFQLTDAKNVKSASLHTRYIQQLQRLVCLVSHNKRLTRPIIPTSLQTSSDHVSSHVRLIRLDAGKIAVLQLMMISEPSCCYFVHEEARVRRLKQTSVSYTLKRCLKCCRRGCVLCITVHYAENCCSCGVWGARKWAHHPSSWRSTLATC